MAEKTAVERAAWTVDWMAASRVDSKAVMTAAYSDALRAEKKAAMRAVSMVATTAGCWAVLKAAYSDGLWADTRAALSVEMMVAHLDASRADRKVDWTAGTRAALMVGSKAGWTAA